MNLKSGFLEEKENKDYLCYACAIIAFLIILSLYIPFFVYIAYIATGFILCVLTPKEVFSLLFFLFPYAGIFKTIPGATSFFTLLEIMALGIVFLDIQKLDIPFLVLSFGFSLSLLFVTSSFIFILKMVIIVGLFYLFTVSYKKKDGKTYLFYFLFGLVSSSILGIMKEDIPRLLSFYDDLNYMWLEGGNVLRFSGIFQDPNYFSIALIQGLMLLGILLFTKGIKNKLGMIIISLFLVGCGLVTLSKSFYLMLALLALGVIWAKSTAIIKFIKNNFLLSLIISAVVLCGGIIFILVDPMGVVEKMLYRFSHGDWSTGRVVIWKGYLEKIQASTHTLLFGYGLDAPYVNKAAHNIYIESVYYIGIVGLTIYILLLTYIVFLNRKKMRRGLYNYFGFFAVALMYAFLCGLMAHDFPFYMMLSFILFNMDLKGDKSDWDEVVFSEPLFQK